MTEAGWRLEGFESHLEEWIELEDPPHDVRRQVILWMLSRIDDPFEGARREAGFPNLWFAVVPGSIHEQLSVVACSYWVDVTDRVVRCDQLATLSYPA